MIPVVDGCVIAGFLRSVYIKSPVRSGSIEAGSIIVGLVVCFVIRISVFLVFLSFTSGSILVLVDSVYHLNKEEST